MSGVEVWEKKRVEMGCWCPLSSEEGGRWEWGSPWASSVSLMCVYAERQRKEAGLTLKSWRLELQENAVFLKEKFFLKGKLLKGSLNNQPAIVRPKAQSLVAVESLSACRREGHAHLNLSLGCPSTKCNDQPMLHTACCYSSSRLSETNL